MIGVFDSGIGGLTVLRHLLKRFPGLPVVYCADTDWMPYGDKPLPEVAQRVQSVLSWLGENVSQRYHQPLKQLVVACNTAASALDLCKASSDAIQPAGQWSLGKNLLEPIRPGCQWLTQAVPEASKVGLLATLGTVNSNQYARLLEAHGAPFFLHSVACPGLATLIERGPWHSAELQKMLAGFLAPLVAWPLDTLVLGCTHYPLVQAAIEAQLRQMLPQRPVRVIDPTVCLVDRLPQGLPSDVTLPIPFYVTGNESAFSSRLAQMDITAFLATQRPIEVLPARHFPPYSG
ncbi:MAG: aspartate/glutamate racemase family protein [Vampirovibrionales bacterium]|nr:aspartate/glutamate racemase family protein [Vampirovibrionales bacterium]